MSQFLQSNHGGPAGPQKLDSLLRFVPIIAAICFAILFSACEKKDSSVIDSIGSPPFIVDASISPSTVTLDLISQNLGSVQFSVESRISHPEGSSGISQVTYTLTDASGSVSLADGMLFDNGVLPDMHAADSVFTAEISVPVQDLSVGKYYCQIVAVSPKGYTSSTLLMPLSVGRQINHPPVLSNLQAPDTISLGGQSRPFKLMVKATDPDGQSDILEVFFYSYKPNGTMTNGGNPFFMFDNGSPVSGDAVAGDSIYTLTVVVDTSNAKGSYKFEFQAEDRSGALSQKLVKNIQVVQ